MTSVVFFRDGSSHFVGFTMSGHSGYACEGHDIVCSALSACCELVLAQLCDSFGFDVCVNVDPKTASVGCDTRKSGTTKESLDIISNLLDGFYRTSSEIQKQYPRFVKCSITEV